MIAQENRQLRAVLGPQSGRELLGGSVRVDEVVLPEHQHGEGERVDDRAEAERRAQAEAILALCNVTIAGMAGEVSPAPPSGVAAPTPGGEPTADTNGGPIDPVEEADLESFPASDAPARTAITGAKPAT